jgi:hypothetical protein
MRAYSQYSAYRMFNNGIRIRSSIQTNPVDSALHTIWSQKGEGLAQFFDAVRTDMMPAGQGIGDSHELFVLLMRQTTISTINIRFKIADSIECKSCKKRQVKEDNVTEFSLSSTGPRVPISDCIMATVKPHDIADWTCESCKSKGCTKQQLIR